MTKYHMISGSIFGLVSLTHLARVLFDWTFQIGTWMVPHWLSILGFLGAGALCIWAFTLERSRS